MLLKLSLIHCLGFVTDYSLSLIEKRRSFNQDAREDYFSTDKGFYPTDLAGPNAYLAVKRREYLVRSSRRKKSTSEAKQSLCWNSLKEMGSDCRLSRFAKAHANSSSLTKLCSMN